MRPLRRFVPQSTIDRRVAQKDDRVSAEIRRRMERQQRLAAVRIAGDDAAEAGRPLDANPHPVGSNEYAEWALGYRDARQRNS